MNNMLRNRLIAIGIPENVFSFRQVNVEEQATTVSWEVTDTKGSVKKTIYESKKQVESYNSLRSSIGTPVVFGFSSSPDDSLAKRAALQLCAEVLMQNKVVHWHPVYGLFDDDYRSGRVKKPDVLILTNVLLESSVTKHECLRDILERYSDITRIVITSGCTARELVTDKLHYKINGMVHLTKKR